MLVGRQDFRRSITLMRLKNRKVIFLKIQIEKTEERSLKYNILLQKHSDRAETRSAHTMGRKWR
jgi:hypothetical protein